MKRLLQTAPLFALLALISGCGLDDYEQKMLRTQAAVQSFDEANLLLGDPLELPKVIEKQGQKEVERDAPVFVRPPQGIARKNDGEPADGLWHYPRERQGIAPNSELGKKMVGGQAVQPMLAPFTDVYVALAVDRKDAREFAAEALRRWGQEQANLKPRQGKIPAGAVAVDVVDFDDASAGYSACLVRGEGSTVLLVVYRYAKDKRDMVHRVVDASMNWIGLDGKASELRKKFAPLMSKQATPPSPAGPPIVSPPPQPPVKQ